MPRQSITMHLPEELVRSVDEARGDVSRTRWIERALEKALHKEPYRASSPVSDEQSEVVVNAPQEPSEQLYRCPVHKSEIRSAPSGRCFCNRKTSEAV